MSNRGANPSLTHTALPERLPDWGVLVLESHHAPDFTMEWRTHPFIKVIYALSGSGRVLVGKSAFQFGPRDVIVVPPRSRNRIIDDDGSASCLYVFCLDPKLVRFDKQRVSQIQAGRLRSSVHVASQIQRRLRRLLYEQAQPSPLTPLTMVGDAIQLLGLLARQPYESEAVDPVTADLDEVAAYIEHLQTHFFEATTIDAAAEHLGLSRRRFTDLFKQLTGQPWLAYVRGLCIDHAKRLLGDTNLPITSVAFECGFEDLSTFYRQFKRHTGFSPGVWRDQRS